MLIEALVVELKALKRPTQECAWLLEESSSSYWISVYFHSLNPSPPREANWSSGGLPPFLNDLLEFLLKSLFFKLPNILMMFLFSAYHSFIGLVDIYQRSRRHMLQRANEKNVVFLLSGDKCSVHL